ncbi:hypothetical protein Cgig2_030248 [Carnegiea gigantea]|uniref:Uncharacterized protein n=1 Tax=Carnegiea gigantea TaxID=171969 RepID=A0A9Q1GFU9_9CARY|nr:hypothetical protein Cgig2_030248 [Carnegiea gigantea]
MNCVVTMIHDDDGVRVFTILDSNKESYKPTREEKNKVQLITNAWGGFFEVIHYVEANEEDLNMVLEVCKSLKKKLIILGEKLVSKSKDLESFVGCDLPKEVEIHPPKPSTTKGSGKRIKGGREEAMEQKQKHPMHCTSCGQYAYHDRQNCPAKDQNNVS